MELTRGAKICYNLKKSPYFQDFYCNSKPYRFYFSSELHKKKFCERLPDHIEKIDKAFSKKFNFPVELPFLAAVDLYIKIESRGFFIRDYKNRCYNRENFALYGLRIGEKLEV